MTHPHDAPPRPSRPDADSGDAPARGASASPAGGREALASALFSASQLASLLLDSQGRVLEASPATVGVFGLDAPPDKGLRAARMLTGVAGERFQELAAQAVSPGLEGAEAVSFEPPGGGGTRSVALSTHPVPGADPGGPAVAVLARDVTEERREVEKLRRGALDVIRLNADLRRESAARQAALQALEELSGRLRGVLEAASRVAIVATSPAGVISVFNPGAANLLGHEPAAMVGLETPLAFLDPDEIARRGRELAAAGGERPAGLAVLMALARSGRRDLGEWTLVRKDGSRFAAEVVLSAIEGAQGAEGYLLVAVDISGRKAAEEAMAEREARLRAVLDGAGDGILAVDQNGRIESANRAAEEMFGAAPGDLSGRPLTEVAPKVRLEGLCALPAERPARRARKPAPSCAVKTRVMTGRRLDGATFPMELTVSAVDLPSRRLCICLARDITVRVKAQEAQRLYTRRLAEQQAALERDLKAAAEIQKSLLPVRLAPDPRYEAGWLFRPSAAIGGDIFNILAPAPDRMDAYMLDVSGHGVPSALVAAAAAQAILLHSREDAASGLPPAPDRVLAALDGEFPLERFDRYFSLFYCSVDLARGRLRHCNGGHPPALLARSGEVQELDEGGTVVGLGGLLPFTTGEVALEAGDTLLIYTDGLTELEDRKGRPFGMERVRAWLGRARGMAAAEALELLSDEIVAFGGPAGPQDDLSVLLITFHGEGLPRKETG
ncbi:SpoIIE family protein phosphatase [Fundidesulfovibrio magnetotacticus]|nr:PAS domain S-box protein [Fundidesulfovibrio magnetotacticus]